MRTQMETQLGSPGGFSGTQAETQMGTPVANPSRNPRGRAGLLWSLNARETDEFIHLVIRTLAGRGVWGEGVSCAVDGSRSHSASLRSASLEEIGGLFASNMTVGVIEEDRFPTLAGCGS